MDKADHSDVETLKAVELWLLLEKKKAQHKLDRNRAKVRRVLGIITGERRFRP